MKKWVTKNNLDSIVCLWLLAGAAGFVNGHSFNATKPITYNYTRGHDLSPRHYDDKAAGNLFLSCYLNFRFKETIFAFNGVDLA